MNEEILAMRNSGLTLTQIANKVGLGVTTIWRIVNRKNYSDSKKEYKKPVRIGRGSTSEYTPIISRHVKVKKNIDSPYKVISLFDIHYPYNINLDNILKFIQDEQPDEIIIGGDGLDLVELSQKFYLGTLEEGMFKAGGHMDEFNKILLKVKSISKNSKITYLMGNHEQRAIDLINERPNRSRLIGIPEHMTAVDTFVSYNIPYTVGTLTYIHGIYCTDAHAKKHVLSYMTDVIYGHLHTRQEYVASTPFNRQGISAKSVGCLCSLDMEYMKRQPSGWSNGFHIAYIYDGYHIDYCIDIKDGKFYRNNTLYGC